MKEINDCSALNVYAAKSTSKQGNVGLSIRSVSLSKREGPYGQLYIAHSHVRTTTRRHYLHVDETFSNSELDTVL